MTRAPDGWNSLPEGYRLLPQFNVDPDIAVSGHHSPAAVTSERPSAATASLL